MLFLPLAFMFLGTFLLGQLPLLLPLSSAASRVLEVLGAGLLCGAAMTVVIPEGTAALFRAQSKLAAGAHAHATASTGAGGAVRGGMMVLMRRHEEHEEHGHAEPRWNAETLLGATLLAGFLVMFV
jgi:zinc transporter 9